MSAENFDRLSAGASIGAGVGGAVLESKSASASAEAQARALEFNARLAELEAQEEAARLRREGRREIGRQIASVGASGVRLEGSPMEVIGRNIFEVERGALQVQEAARRSGSVLRAGASSARQTGRLTSASALLGGAAKTFSGLRRLR